jgi:hypothetical protein
LGIRGNTRRETRCDWLGVPGQCIY